MIDVQRLVLAMREVMYDAKGWGLAAPQIGVPVRVFIVHVPEESQIPLVFVNPSIKALSTELVELNEGCLSFRGIREPITRPATVTIQRYNEYGNLDCYEFGQWTGRAIQHEMEHLDGELLIDQLAPASRRMLDRLLRRKGTKRAAAIDQKAGAMIPAATSEPRMAPHLKGNP